MPRIISNVQFDISDVDFYWYREFNLDSDIETGVNAVYNGITYPDIAWVEGFEEIGEQIWHYELIFGGHGLTGANGLLTGGTVTGFMEINRETGATMFAVDNISVPATSVSSVFSTESSSDEIRLIETLLAGDDEFYLSAMADRALGLSGNDHMEGAGGDDYLDGGAGNDTIIGGAGADVMIGGLGNDIMVVDDADDVVTETANGGNDTVRSTISYILGDNVEDLELIGDGAAINGTGNNLDNGILGTTGANVLDGGGGNDILIGVAGADTLRGGAGNDIYQIDDVAQTIVERANEGTDTVHATVSYTLSDQVEKLVLEESAGAIDGTGNDQANDIKGNSDDNVIRGENGDDVLEGGDGDDKLYGGGDADILIGGDGSDDLYGGSHADILYAHTGDSAGEWDRLDGGEGADQFFVDADDHVHAFEADDVSIVFNTDYDVGRIAIIYDGSTEVRGYSAGNSSYESFWIDEGVRPIFLSAETYSGIGQGIILKNASNPPADLYAFAINQQDAEQDARQTIEDSWTEFKREALKSELADYAVDKSQQAITEFLARRGSDLAKEAIEQFFKEVNVTVSVAEFGASTLEIFQKYMSGAYDGKSHVAAQDLGAAISDLVIPVPGAGPAFKLGTDLAADLISRVAFAFSDSITITYDDLQSGRLNEGTEGSDILIQDGDQQRYYFGAGDDLLIESDQPGPNAGQAAVGMHSNAGAPAQPNAATGAELAQTYDGGEGVDTVAYNVTGAMQVDLTAGTAQRDGAATDTLVSIENISTGDGDDTIVGSAAANSLWGGDGNDSLAGGAGDDIIDGGAGTDTAVYAGSRSDYTVTVNDGVVEIASSVHGTDQLTGVEMFSFGGTTYSLAQLTTPSQPATDQFSLIAPDGFVGTVEGVGRVIGSAGTQDIAVGDGPGRIQFDASFNGGGDRIRLSGSAGDYVVSRSGSSLIIADSDTTIAVPVGPNGADIIFDDGVRTITFSSEEGLRLGEQAVTTTPTTISSPAGPPTAEGETDPEESGRLIMVRDGEAGVGGNVDIIGTTGSETISLFAGSEAVFDASFNSGGDVIELSGVADDYTAVRSGSAVIISDGSTVARIPVSPEETIISLDDGDYMLFVDTALGGIVLGGTVIQSVPTEFS